MKLYAIKNSENELYFQLEKKDKTIEIINSVAYILFNSTKFTFDNEWQEGFPDKECYLGYESKGVFIAATISENRVHLLIRGLKDSVKTEKVKKLIFENYKLVAPVPES